MPLDDPEGGPSLAVEYFRDMLAACARFQTWSHQNTAEKAKLRVHPTALPPPKNDNGVYSLDELVGYRPFAIVWGERYKRTRVGTGAYSESGTINVQLEQAVPATLANDPQQLLRAFENDLGVIINQLEVLAYQAGYVAFNDVELQGPWREEFNAIPQQGDHVFGFVSLNWGTEG